MLALLALACALFCVAVRAQSAVPSAVANPNTLADARALLESGRYPDAIASFEAILRKQPANEAAAIGLADAYRRVHNLDEARSVLTAARRVHPRSLAVLKAFGSLEIEAQSWDAAIDVLRPAIAMAPRDTEARDFLASALQGKGDPAAAVAQLDREIAQNPQDRLARFLRAQCEADLNQNEKALADAEAVVRARADYLPARVLLAKILVREKQCERAVETLRPSQTPVPQNSSAQQNSSAPGNSPVQNSAAPLQLDAQALFLLANAYDYAGQAQFATATRDEFARASDADRKRAEDETQSKHLVEQAGTLAQQNRFREALDLLQQALEKNPRNGFAYSQQAKIFFSMREFDRARAAIAQALEIQPYQPDFLYVKGVIAEHGGNAAEALAAFEEVTRINPKEADAFFEIGKIRLQQGERNAARTAFEKAAKLDPQEPEYKRAAESVSSPN
jgi:tetratricopeptide (TPR) repeat protein